jgi:galactonate dehydratase
LGDVIRRIRTLRRPEHPDTVWVEVGTRDGGCGVGEAVLSAGALETYIHDVAAPSLLGQSPGEIEHHDRTLRGYLGYDGNGVATRGNAALNIALWDLLGRGCGRPLHVLLGGCSRAEVLGCVKVPRLPAPDPGDTVGLDARHAETASRYASILRSDDISLAKFTVPATSQPDGGAAAGADGLGAVARVLTDLRDVLGDRTDVVIDAAGALDVVAPESLGGILGAVSPVWIENPTTSRDAPVFIEIAKRTGLSVGDGNFSGSVSKLRELLSTGSIGVVVLDLGYAGGLSAARKIAALAEGYEVSVEPRDSGSPVLLAASLHLSAHAPNAIAQEYSVDRRDWSDIITGDIPSVRHGAFRLPEAAGLGVGLRPSAWTRPGSQVRSSELA